MEIVDYYYKILELPFDAKVEHIYAAYNSKIEKYRNLPFLNTSQKAEVKELKKAKFVLSNDEFRKIYDSSISKKGSGLLIPPPLTATSIFSENCNRTSIIELSSLKFVASA